MVYLLYSGNDAKLKFIPKRHFRYIYLEIHNTTTYNVKLSSKFHGNIIYRICIYKTSLCNINIP